MGFVSHENGDRRSKVTGWNHQYWQDWKCWNRLFFVSRVCSPHCQPSKSKVHYWAYLWPCTGGSYASLSVWHSVCMSLDQISRKKFISWKPFDLGPPYLVWWWTLMISRSCVKVIAQISRLSCQKMWFFEDSAMCILTCDLRVKGSGSRSRGSGLKVKVTKHSKIYV